MKVARKEGYREKEMMEDSKRFFKLLAITWTASLTIVGFAHSEEVLKANPQILKKGEEAYKNNCMSCHGDKGDGKGPAGAAVNAASFLGKLKRGSSPQAVFDVITNGVTGTTMIGWKQQLSLEERSGLTYKVLSFGKDSSKKTR